MKKLLTSILVAVLLLASVVGIFAACDNRDYDHTIVFYNTQNDKMQAITATAVARFQAKFPGWKVETVQPGGYDELRAKIVQDLSGKKQPDLAYCYSDHVALYMQKKKVIDLNTLINSTETVNGKVIEFTDKYVATGDTAYTVGFESLDNFVPAFLQDGLGENFTGAGRYGYSATSLLTMPFMKSTEALFYNETALKFLMNELKNDSRPELAYFSDDGGTTLKIPRTWQDLWLQAPVVAEYFPTATLLGYDSEANWFITESERQGWGYTSTNENDHYLFNNPRAQAWLNFIYDFNEQAYITTQGISGGYTSKLFTKGVGTVTSKAGKQYKVDNGDGGGILYCVGSTGGAGNQESDKFTWKVAQIPGSYVGTYKKVGSNWTFEKTPSTGYTLRAGDTATSDGFVISDYCISQGPSLVMLRSDKAKNADEKAKMTFLFMKELFEADIQADLCILQGYTPAILDCADKNAAFEDYLKTKDITAQAINLANQLAAKGYFFSSPAFVGSSTARTQVGNALKAVLAGSADGTEALATARKNCK